MSALNIFISGDEAHIVTDGAAATFGVLALFANKSVVMSQLGLAIGFRGNMGILNRLRHALGKYSSQPAALAGLPGQLRKSFSLGAKVFPKLYGFDIAVIGHAGGRPFAKILSSVTRPGQPAFQWLDIPGIWASPPIDGNHLAEIRDTLSEGQIDAAAVALVDAQRTANVVSVGGFAEITTATADGFTTKLLARWPDQRGKKIDVSKGRLPINAKPPARGGGRRG